MQTLKVPYGLRDGKLLYIGEIPESERGLACKCVCPACHHPLQANLGRKNRHYFSHAVSSDCEGAAETGLHLKAKELIAEKQQISLPALTVTATGRARPRDSLLHRDAIKKTVVEGGTLAHFDSVLVEQPRGSIRPDIIGVLAGTELYIEVRVTHRVNDQKRAEIQRQGVSAIEIDLSDIDRMASPAEIAEALSDTKLSHWLFHRREALVRREVKRLEREARIRAEKEERQAEERRQQKKHAFHERLSSLCRALNNRLIAGAPVTLPQPTPGPGDLAALPEDGVVALADDGMIALPEDYGAGLEIAVAMDSMVQAIRTSPGGQEERFMIFWVYHAPGYHEPYRWRSFPRITGPSCLIDVSPMLRGHQRSQWSDTELDSFLLRPPGDRDNWLWLPASIEAQLEEVRSVRKARLEAIRKEREERTRLADEARQKRQQEARERLKREQEELAAQKREENLRLEGRYRDGHLGKTLSTMASITEKGRQLVSQVAERQALIQKTRQDMAAPAPARWMPVKEISASHPPLKTATAEWISGRWSQVARVYPYEWVFAIHPDALKVAILDRIAGDQQAIGKDALLKVVFACLSETKQPGAKGDGFGSLFFRAAKWVSDVDDAVRRIQHLMEWRLDGELLPESSLLSEARNHIEAVTQLVEQLSAGRDPGSVTTEHPALWHLSKRDAVSVFCSALLDDLPSLQHSATGEGALPGEKG